MNLGNIFKDVVVGILPDGLRKNLKNKALRWGERGVHEFLHTSQDAAEEYSAMRESFLDAAAIESLKKSRYTGCDIKQAIRETGFIQSTMKKGLREGDEISAEEVEGYVQRNEAKLLHRLRTFD